jgi:hypothetical protein
MSRLPKLRQTRSELLLHIGALEEMRRGSVTRQFLKVRRQDSSEPVFSGPYPLFTFKKDGKTVSRRLRDPEEILRLEQQVENFHAFRRLCSRLVEVSEAICDEKERK